MSKRVGNPYHGPDGKFASGPGAGGGSDESKSGYCYENSSMNCLPGYPRTMPMQSRRVCQRKNGA